VSTLARPTNPSDFAEATWPDVLPHYEDLAQRPLDRVEDWLSDWSRLETLLSETSHVAFIEYTRDTADAEKERRYLRWATEIDPQRDEQAVRLSKRLVESGWSREDMETSIRRWRNQIELFRESNVPLQSALSKLGAAYQKLTGGMSVDWEGEKQTVPQVEARLGNPDREVRERAFRLHLQPYIEARDDIAGLFDQMLALRQKVAHNAGFANYRDFAHREKNRFDYTPDDCRRWQEAVEATAVPAWERILGRRRQLMGVETLRPWDVVGWPDPLGRAQLRPFTEDQEFRERSLNVFSHVSPDLGIYFKTMIDEDLLDLQSRHGKAPGGYCHSLPFRKRPFIFMNGAGIARDVETIVHEAGHAFHAFECMSALPLSFQRMYNMEMAEVASMSMELLASRHLGADEGGFYSEQDLIRARRNHLEGIVMGVCHIASVDAMQQWLYTDPAAADRDLRDQKWLELRRRFERGIDWSGLDTLRVARWYRQLHFYLYPFYYIEYGLAQLGALQVWRNSLRDPEGAVAAYRRALSLGGSRPLPELYAAAGARLVFDTGGMAELVGLVEEELAALR
jgi:oligoendopeptidase F